MLEADVLVGLGCFTVNVLPLVASAKSRVCTL